MLVGTINEKLGYSCNLWQQNDNFGKVKTANNNL